MFPMKGINPKQMERMMRQMGVKVEEVEGVEKVVMYRAAGDIVITKPQVTKMKIMGKTTFQVVGEESPLEKSKSEGAQPRGSVEVSEDDVELVATQAKTSKEKAREALIAAKGDIAEAILSLSK